MKSSVQIVLICEDTQHECFARRFLMKRGYRLHDFRIVKSPRGRGSGEQWVRAQFPAELQRYRQRSTHAQTCLIAITDADVHTPDMRLRDCEQACLDQGVERRHEWERVAFVTPARNIESWIAYLGGADIDEATRYGKLRYERDCQNAVETLDAMCREGKLREPAPPSLRQSCREFERLLL